MSPDSVSVSGLFPKRGAGQRSTNFRHIGTVSFSARGPDKLRVTIRGRRCRPHLEGTSMKKTMFALATAAVLAAGSLSAPTTAEARCYGCAVGAGVAAGGVGGGPLGGAVAHTGAADSAHP